MRLVCMVTALGIAVPGAVLILDVFYIIFFALLCNVNMDFWRKLVYNINKGFCPFFFFFCYTWQQVVFILM